MFRLIGLRNCVHKNFEGRVQNVSQIEQVVVEQDFLRLLRLGFLKANIRLGETDPTIVERKEILIKAGNKLVNPITAHGVDYALGVLQSMGSAPQNRSEQMAMRPADISSQPVRQSSANDKSFRP